MHRSSHRIRFKTSSLCFPPYGCSAVTAFVPGYVVLFTFAVDSGHASLKSRLLLQAMLIDSITRYFFILFKGHVLLKSLSIMSENYCFYQYSFISLALMFLFFFEHLTKNVSVEIFTTKCFPFQLFVYYVGSTGSLNKSAFFVFGTCFVFISFARPLHGTENVCVVYECSVPSSLNLFCFATLF